MQLLGAYLTSIKKPHVIETVHYDQELNKKIYGALWKS